jgi:type II secretory ATPase GspE/PulE/Tfp pilus assembly ATPase PilB-like protein
VGTHRGEACGDGDPEFLLSTLHTNSAVATIPRLIEMGVEGYLLRATLIAVLAQRLVRHNCSECRVVDDIDAHMRELLGVSAGERFMRGAGCSACDGTGIRGRRMTYEYLQITPSLRHTLEAGIDEIQMQDQALRDGMVPLTQHAIALARAGEISLHEAYATRLE